MSKQRKQHTAQFKVKAVNESLIKGNVTEVARYFSINPNQLSMWRKTFMDNAYLAFESNSETIEKKYSKKVQDLENLIGKKEVEISLLKKYLDFYVPVDGN